MKNYKELIERSFKSYQDELVIRKQFQLDNNAGAAETIIAWDKFEAERQEKLAKIRETFPFSIVYENAFPAFDFVHRWCWQTLGPPQIEKCNDSYSEYPACPLVLATKHIVKRRYGGPDNTTIEEDEICYNAPEQHSHEGVWQFFFYQKTNYDWGFGEYLFKNEADLHRFIDEMPNFSCGELYSFLQYDGYNNVISVKED